MTESHDNQFTSSAPRFCIKCGTALSPSQKFCSNCGNPIPIAIQPEPQPEPQPDPAPEPIEEPNYRFCNSCGTKHSEGQNFCNVCGASLTGHNSAKEESAQPAPKENPVNKSSIVTVLKRTIVLALAILMIIAVFSPVLESKINLKDFGFDVNKKVDINLTMLDTIKIFQGSLEQLDVDDYHDELGDIDDEYEDYFDSWEDGKKLSAMSRYLKEYLIAAYKSDNFSMPILVIPTLLTAITVILVIVLAVLSALSFLSSWMPNLKAHDKSTLFLVGMTAIMMLASMAAINFALVVSQALMIEWEIASFQTALYVAIAISLIVILVLNLIAKRSKIKGSEIVKRSLCIVFAIVVLVSAFLPIMSVETKATFDGETKARSATQDVTPSIFVYVDANASTENIKEVFENYSSSKEMYTYTHNRFNDLSLYTKREFEKGNAHLVTYDVFNYLLLGFGAFPYAPLIAYCGFMAPIAAIICSLTIIWINLCEFAEREKRRGASKILSKIFSILTSAILVGLCIAMSVIIKFNANSIDIDFGAVITAGPILTFIFSVAMTCVPSVKAKEYEE